MSSILKGLKAVVLDCPYDLLSHERVQQIFARTLALKIEGYREVYPYGVLPVDSYDYIATHHLVCRVEGDQLHPISGYKSITLERCKLHRLPFPGLVVLGSSGAREHYGALQAILDEEDSQGRRVSYESSWTISAEVRDDRELKRVAKEILTAMLVNWEIQIGSSMRFTCGVPKVRSDEYFEFLGYERVQSEEKDLPAFQQNSLLGEEAVLMQNLRFSPEAMQLFDRYRFFVNGGERYLAPDPRVQLAQEEKKKAA